MHLIGVAVEEGQEGSDSTDTSQIEKWRENKHQGGQRWGNFSVTQSTWSEYNMNFLRRNDVSQE